MRRAVKSTVRKMHHNAPICSKPPKIGRSIAPSRSIPAGAGKPLPMLHPYRPPGKPLRVLHTPPLSTSPALQNLWPRQCETLRVSIFMWMMMMSPPVMTVPLSSTSDSSIEVNSSKSEIGVRVEPGLWTIRRVSESPSGL